MIVSRLIGNRDDASSGVALSDKSPSFSSKLGVLPVACAINGFGFICVCVGETGLTICFSGEKIESDEIFLSRSFKSTGNSFPIGVPMFFEVNCSLTLLSIGSRYESFAKD